MNTANSKGSKYLNTLAAELETRIAMGDLRGYTVAQLEAAAVRYRNLAARR
jgi:hypothetical protein